MLPDVAVVRVVNSAPHVQVTCVSTYSGWMFCFTGAPRVDGRRVVARGRDVNRSQRTSVPCTAASSTTRARGRAFRAREASDPQDAARLAGHGVRVEARQ